MNTPATRDLFVPSHTHFGEEALLPFRKKAAGCIRWVRLSFGINPMSLDKHTFVTLALATLVLALFALEPAMACGEQDPCEVATGSYLVRPPAGWDGKGQLPVIIFFHGAFSDAKDSIARVDLKQAADSVGALFVAADGANKNWSFPGKSAPGARDDVAYAMAVLDDVEKRYPINKTQVLASGFSVGGSMVWYLACLAPKGFTAFAPVAGAFWEPLPDTCPAGPVSLRHVHGMADQTVPMKGRSLRNGLYKQGDVMESFRRLKLRDGCAEEPDQTETKDKLVCRTWSAKSCTSHREVVLCLHPEDHFVDGNWVADGFRWMQQLKAD
jgi:polyhydroxybutyrate depolymerase